MSRVSAPQVFHVDSPTAGTTVVAALRKWLPGLSWSAAKGLLGARRVSVNGAMCLDGGRRLKAGEVVHVFAHSRTPQPTAEDVEVLYCDEHVVVVVKPALMTTLRHREERGWKESRKNVQPTLDEVLPRIVQAMEGPARGERAERGRGRHTAPRRSRHVDRRARLPRIVAVHRLDRDTSGVMVFARTPVAEQKLVKQFKQHTIERVYLAVLHGHVEPQTIETQLVRDRGDGLRGSAREGEEGERAVTHVRPVEDLGEYSLVECRLETGRTHQIRIHLSERGHLVCGDPTYRKRREGPPVEDQSGAPRLALHAARLAFEHPVTGEWLEFDAELPEDLARFVVRLRKRTDRP